MLPAHEELSRDRSQPGPEARGSVLGAEWEHLTDAQFLSHFAAPRPARHPALPAPAPEQLTNADEVLAGRFRLIGESYRLGQGFSWADNPSRDKEWQIAHHKFYFAVDLAQAWRSRRDRRYLEAWSQLIGSWLREMGSGFVRASDAQVEAKRVEHWVLSFLILQSADGVRYVPAALLRSFVERIGAEARYIGAHLRPARNHRTFQLYAMFLAGVMFPELRDSVSLTETARKLLIENLLQDFRPDGVHVELSTHYHQITLETALAFYELSLLNGLEIEPALAQRLHAALEFSLYVAWPDGRMPLINDSDDGDHLPLLHQGARLFDDERLLWVASGGRAGASPESLHRRFADSGYIVMTDTWGGDAQGYSQRQHLFYDCGRLGEGSHSHYDLLNFCYFAGGDPIVVDPGRYTYDAQPGADGLDWRREFKSTRFHNTVTIDGLDQTRYLSKANNPPPGVERYNRSVHTAKHGPDAEAIGLQYAFGERTDWVWASVNSLEYHPLHTRLMVFMARQYLLIWDHIGIDDETEHEAALHFHFDPRWMKRVSLDRDADEFVLHAPTWQLRCLRQPGLETSLDTGWCSTRYGEKSPAPVLRSVQRGRRSMSFVSVLAHQSAVADGLRVAGLRRICADEAGGETLEVQGMAGSLPFVDRYAIHPDGMVEHVEGQIEYRGAFLAYRRDMGGALEYLCAARPQMLRVHHPVGVKRSMGGHVEWRCLDGGAGK